MRTNSESSRRIFRQPSAHRAWRRALVHGLVVGAALGCPKRGAAEPARWSLDWRGPQGCGSAAEVREGVRRHLGASADASPDHPLAITAFLDTADSSYRLRLVVVGGQSHGERVLQTQSCSEAIRATTVLIALAIAPSLGNTDGEQAPASASPALAPDLRNTLTEEPPAQEAPAHESPTTVYDEPTPHSAAYGDAASNRTGVLSTDPPGVDRVPSPPARRRFERKLQAPLKPAEPAAPMPPRSNRPGTSSELRAAALINVGDLPSIALGLGIGGTWALPYSTVVFGVSGYPKQPEQIPGTVEGRAEFWSVGVHLALCRDLLKTRFRFGPCAGFRGAILRGDGEGSDLENRSGEAKLLLGPTLGVDGGLTLLESLSLVAAIHAHWLPARPRFVVDGATPVHRPEAIGAVASLGVATSWR